MKAAVAGVGRMGLRHLEALSGHEIVGVADSRDAARAQASSLFSFEDDLLFGDAKQMLEAKHPDVFVVATTAGAHCELVCAAADVGVPFVLVEKPMAQSLDECRRMIDRCSERGTRLAVNHQRRYFDIHAYAKGLIESDRIGGLSSMTVVGGNFGIAMNGTHYFETFEFLSGQTPVEVTGWLSDTGSPNPRGAEFRDWAGEVRVVGVQGASLHLIAKSTQGHGLTSVYSGPSGQVVVDELNNIVLIDARQSEHRGEPSARYAMPSDHTQQSFPAPSVVDATRRLIDDLVNGEDIPTPEEGMSALAVLTAAVESNGDGYRPVVVDETLNSIHLPIA